jgi:hypothetical protein
VERGVLEKVYIAILATPETFVQHLLSHSPSQLLPIQSTDQLSLICADDCYRFTYVQDTALSTALTTLKYCLYPACHIAYSAALSQCTEEPD